MDRPGGQESGWLRFLLAFLEERNIKWLLGVGISLVLAASAYFVHTNWALFEQLPFLQYVLIAGFTAACTGMATLLGEKAGLPRTARAFHLTALFLVPLNFVAMWLPAIGLFRGKGPAPEIGFALGIAVYPFLWWVLARSLRGALGSTTWKVTFALLGGAGLLPWSTPGTIAGGIAVLGAWILAVWGIAQSRRHYVLGRRLESPELFLLPSGGLVGVLLAHVLIASPEGPWNGLLMAIFAIPILHLAHALGEALLAQDEPSSQDLPRALMMGAHALGLVGTALAYGGRIQGNPPLAVTLALATVLLASTAVVRGSRLARRLAIAAGAPLLLSMVALDPIVYSVWEDCARFMLGDEAGSNTALALLLAVLYLLLTVPFGEGSVKDPEWGAWRDDLFTASGVLAGLLSALVITDPRAATPVLAAAALGTAWTWRRLVVDDLLLASALLATAAAGEGVLLAGGGPVALLWLLAVAAAVWIWAMAKVDAGRAQPGPLTRLLGQGNRHPLGLAALLTLEAGLLLALFGPMAGLEATLATIALCAVAGVAFDLRGLRFDPIAWTLGLATVLGLRGWLPLNVLDWMVWHDLRIVLLPLTAAGAGLWALGWWTGRREESTHPLEVMGSLLVLLTLAAAPFHLQEGVAVAQAAAFFGGIAAALSRRRPLLTLAGGAAAMAIVMIVDHLGGMLAAASALALLGAGFTFAGFGLRVRIEAHFPAATPWGQALRINPLIDLGALFAVVLCLLATALSSFDAYWPSGPLFTLLAMVIFVIGSLYYGDGGPDGSDSRFLPAALLTCLALLASSWALLMAASSESAFGFALLFSATVAAVHQGIVWACAGRLPGGLARAHSWFADLLGVLLVWQVLLVAPSLASGMACLILVVALAIPFGSRQGVKAQEGEPQRGISDSVRRVACFELALLAGYLGVRAGGLAAPWALALLAVGHLAGDLAGRGRHRGAWGVLEECELFLVNMTLFAALGFLTGGLGQATGVTFAALAIVAGRRAEESGNRSAGATSIVLGMLAAVALIPEPWRSGRIAPLFAAVLAWGTLALAEWRRRRQSSSVLPPDLEVAARGLALLGALAGLYVIFLKEPSRLYGLLGLRLCGPPEIVLAAIGILFLAARFDRAGEPGWRWLSAGSGFAAILLGVTGGIAHAGLEAAALAGIGTLLVHADLLRQRGGGPAVSLDKLGTSGLKGLGTNGLEGLRTGGESSHWHEPLAVTGMACLLVPFVRLVLLAVGTLFDRPLVLLNARDLGLVLTAEGIVFASVLHRKHGVALLGLVLTAGSIGAVSLLGWAGLPLAWALEAVAWVDLFLAQAMARGAESAAGRWAERATGERLSAAVWQVRTMSGLAAVSSLLVLGGIESWSRALLLTLASFHWLRLDPVPALHGGFAGFALLSSAAFLQLVVAGLVARGVDLGQFFREPWFASAALLLSGIWLRAWRRLAASHEATDPRVAFSRRLADCAMLAAAAGGAAAIPSGLGLGVEPVGRLAVIVAIECVAGIFLRRTFPLAASLSQAVGLMAWPAVALTAFLTWHDASGHGLYYFWYHPWMPLTILLVAAGYRGLAWLQRRVEDSEAPSTANEIEWLAGAAAFLAQVAVFCPLLLSTFDRPPEVLVMVECLAFTLAAHLIRPSRPGQYVAWVTWAAAIWSLNSFQQVGYEHFQQTFLRWPVAASVGAGLAVVYRLLANRLPEERRPPSELEAAPLGWAATTIAWFSGLIAAMVAFYCVEALAWAVEPRMHWNLTVPFGAAGTVRGADASAYLAQQLIWLSGLFAVLAFAARSRFWRIMARGCLHSLVGLLCFEGAFALAAATDPGLPPAFTLAIAILAWAFLLEVGRLLARGVWGNLQSNFVSQLALAAVLAALAQLGGPDRAIILALVAGVASFIRFGGSEETGFAAFTLAASAAVIQIAATGCQQSQVPLDRFALDGPGALLMFGLFLVWDQFARQLERESGEADARRLWAVQLAEGSLGAACILALASAPACMGTQWSHVVRMLLSSAVLLAGGIRLRADSPSCAALFGSAGLVGWPSVVVIGYAAATGTATGLPRFVFDWPHLALALAIGAYGFRAMEVVSRKRITRDEIFDPVRDPERLALCSRVTAYLSFSAAAAAAIWIALDKSQPLPGISFSMGLAAAMLALLPRVSGQAAFGALGTLVFLLASGAWFERRGWLPDATVIWPVMATLALLPAMLFLGVMRARERGDAPGPLGFAELEACRILSGKTIWLAGLLSWACLPVVLSSVLECVDQLVGGHAFPGAADSFTRVQSIGHVTLAPVWLAMLWLAVSKVTGGRWWIRGAALLLTVSLSGLAVWGLGIVGAGSFAGALEAIALVMIGLAWAAGHLGDRGLTREEWLAGRTLLAPVASLIAAGGWVYAAFWMSRAETAGMLAVATAVTLTAAALEARSWIFALAIMSLGAVLVDLAWLAFPQGTPLVELIRWPVLAAIFWGYGWALGWAGRKAAAARRGQGTASGWARRVDPAAALRVSNLLLRAAGPISLAVLLPRGAVWSLSIPRLAAGLCVQLGLLATTGARWLESSTLILGSVVTALVCYRHVTIPEVMLRSYPFHVVAALLIVGAAVLGALERRAGQGAPGVGRLLGRLHRETTLAWFATALERLAMLALLGALVKALASGGGTQSGIACALAGLLCLPLRLRATDLADAGLALGLSFAAYEFAFAAMGQTIEGLVRTPAFCAVSLGLAAVWGAAGRWRRGAQVENSNGAFTPMAEIAHLLACVGTMAALANALGKPASMTAAAALGAGALIHLSRLVAAREPGPTESAVWSFAAVLFTAGAIVETCLAVLPKRVFDPALLGWPLAPLLLLAVAWRLLAEGGRFADSELRRRLRIFFGEGTFPTLAAHAAAFLVLLGPLHHSSPDFGRIWSLLLAATTIGGAARLLESGRWAFVGAALAVAVPFRLAWLIAGEQAPALLVGWPLFAYASAASWLLLDRLARHRAPVWAAEPLRRLSEVALAGVAYCALGTLERAAQAGPGAACRLALLSLLAGLLRRRLEWPVLGLAAGALATLSVGNVALFAACGSGALTAAGVPVAAATFALLALVWESLVAARRPSWCPPELFGPLPTRILAMGSLLVALGCFRMHPDPVTAGAMVTALAASGLYFLRTAHVGGDERAVYLGEAALAGVYVYLRTSGLVQGSAWSGFIGVMLNFLLLGASHLAERWRSPVFARPMARTALAVPFVLMALFLHRGATPANILMVFASASFYSSASTQSRWYPLRFVGAVLYNVGLAMVWTRIELRSWTAYLAPLGMTLLWASEIEKDSFSPGARARLRQLANALLMASPVIGFASEQSVGSMLWLAAACLASIFFGIWLRIRSFLYFGTVLLAGDLIGFTGMKWQDGSVSVVAIVLSAGGAVLALAAFFEKKREELTRRIEKLQSELASWE